MTNENRKRNGKMTARVLALQVLLEVEEQSAYSNLALQKALAHYMLPPKEKSLATEIVYGTIQRLNTIDYRLHSFVKPSLAKLDGWVRNLLRLSVYQLDYLERVPDFAVINEAVEIAKQRNPKVSGLVNAVLRNILRSGKPIFPSIEKEPILHLSLVHSHPEWLVREWVSQYGIDEAVRICSANNERPLITLRANRLKASREEVLTALAKDNIQAKASTLIPEGIRLLSGIDIRKLQAFREGLCTVQDESSMLVGHSLAPQTGMRILDACAAPGGKTTHLAELMGDQGEIIAADIHEHKVELIRNIKDRLGLQSIQTVTGDIRELLPASGQFDAVLLDAPCSGFGVIRRKPDIKWRKSLEDVQAIRDLQFDLLQKVAQSVKPGGILIYSTCTIERKENEEIIRSFLKECPNFKIESLSSFLPTSVMEIAGTNDGWVQVLPHHFGTDGFFICRMRKMSETGGDSHRNRN